MSASKTVPRAGQLHHGWERHWWQVWHHQAQIRTRRREKSFPKGLKQLFQTWTEAMDLRMPRLAETWKYQCPRTQAAQQWCSELKSLGRVP